MFAQSVPIDKTYLISFYVLSQAQEVTDVRLLICHQNFKLIKRFLERCIILNYLLYSN